MYDREDGLLAIDPDALTKCAQTFQARFLVAFWNVISSLHSAINGCGWDTQAIPHQYCTVLYSSALQ
jgi:hypothetical protein